MKNPDTLTPASADNTSLLLFTDNGQLYAIPSLSVQEILYPQALTPLPFVPPAVEGLINVDGRIAVQLNLARLAGHDGAIPAYHELVLVETGRALCALRVDEVLSREAFSLVAATAPADDASPFSALVTAQIDWQGNAVQVLSPTALGDLVQPRASGTTGTGLIGSTLDNSHTEQSTVQCLSLMAGDTAYALPLRCVTEILEAGPCTPLPGSSDAIDGLYLLRDQVVVVIDLASRLGLPRTRASGTGWYVVIKHPQGHCALAVETVMEIEQLASQYYQPGSDSHAAASGVFALPSGSRILLDPDSLVDADTASLLSRHAATHEKTVQAAEAQERFLEVLLANTRYAIPASTVRRISATLPIEPARDDDGRVRGAVEMEGRIVPVLALEAGLSLSQPAQDKEFILVQYGDTAWAIGVDAVQRIISVPVSHIRQLHRQDDRYISGVIQLDTGLLSILDVSQATQEHTA